MSGGIDDEKKVVDSNEASKEWEDKVLLETSQDLCEVETDTLRVKIKKDWEELQLHVKAKKEDVAATEKKEDVAATEKKEDVAATEKKEDVAATEKKEDVAVTEKKEDVAATEKKEDVAATEKKEDVAATEKKEDTAATEDDTEESDDNKKSDNEPQRKIDTYVATPDSQIDTPDKAAAEIKNMLNSLCTEIQPDSTWSIVLTSTQMWKLDRINSLRYRNFVSPLPPELVAALGDWATITAEDLKDEKSIKQARKRLRKQLKDEKKYNKQLGKLIDQYIKTLNAKNSTNYSLNKIWALWQINDVLDNWTYINTSIAFLPENGPLILDIFRNRDNIKKWHVKLQYQWKPIDVYSDTFSWNANWAIQQLASCWGYANIWEKFLTENTKMSQWQARNMINTLWTLWMVWAVVWIWYWLFTEKTATWRKFSFPSIWKLAAAITIPTVLHYWSEMATGNWFMDNLAKLWKTWEFPWGSSILEGQSLSEQMAAHQVMWQFVLLWVPFEVLAKAWTFNWGKMTKVDINKVAEYLKSQETILSWADQMRVRTQLEAINRLDSNAKLALNNYISGLQISESDIKDSNKATETLDARLWKANEKYWKMMNYLESKKLIINPDKKDKIVDTLFKTDKVTDKVFDELKDEWCFLPDSPIYKEIEKLTGVDTSKKVKIYEAFTKLWAEWTWYGKMKLEIDTSNNKLKLTSWNDNEILLNIDNTIDNLENDAWVKLELSSEEELMRTGLFINYLKKTLWNENVKRWIDNKPFVLGSSMKLWDDIQFLKPSWPITVLSSMTPFLSEMARKFPTIENKNNRQFLVNYLNKLWAEDHTE